MCLNSEAVFRYSDPTMSIPTLFAGKGIQEALCVALLSPLRKKFRFSADSTRSEVTLAVGAAAFAELSPIRKGVRVTIILGHALEAPRIDRTENVAKGRIHNQIDLTRLDQVDDELIGWLEQACSRAGSAH